MHYQLLLSGSSPLSFLLSCDIKEVPTPEPIATPRAIHNPRLSVAIPIAVPIPTPYVIPRVNLFSFSILYYFS